MSDSTRDGGRGNRRVGQDAARRGYEDDGRTGEPDLVCFANDHGDMPLDARKAAIRLKSGRVIMAYAADGLYDSLLYYRDDVERSLNNDLLALYVDEQNQVAWASRVQEVDATSLLDCQRLSSNELNVLVALIHILMQSRNQGFYGAGECFATRKELWEAFRSQNPRLAEDTRGEKVNAAFGNALEQARRRQWVEVVDEERYRVLPTVAALFDGDFVREAIAQLCGAEEPESAGEDNGKGRGAGEGAGARTAEGAGLEFFEEANARD